MGFREGGYSESELGLYYGDMIDRGSPLNRGLVARYTVVPWYKSGPRWIDLAGKNHGTLTNGPTWSGITHPGGFGSLAFDGTDDVVLLGEPASIKALTLITVSAWVRTTSTSRQGIVTWWGAAGGRKFELSIADGTTGPTFRVSTDGTDFDGSGDAGALATNEWHMLTGVYDGTNALIYVDGILMNSGVISSMYTGPTGEQLRIGSDTVGIMSGSINSVSIIGRALSANEILQLYDDSIAGSPRTLRRISKKTYSFPIGNRGGVSGPIAKSPVLYYGDLINRSNPLNRGLVTQYTVVPWYKSGPRWIDLAGRNHGTLTNGPTWSSLTHQGGFGSLAFDGSNDYIELSQLKQITTGSIRVCCRANSIPGGFTGIFGWTNKISGNWSVFMIGITGGTLEFSSQLGGGGNNFILSSSAISTNTWYDIVGTFDGTIARLYVNGIQVDNDTSIGSEFYYDAAGQWLPAIGCDTNGLTGARGGFFPGYITNASLFDRCLSEQEVKSLYQDSLTSFPKTLNWIQPQTYSFTLPNRSGGNTYVTKRPVLYYGDPINRSCALNRGLVASYTVVPWYKSGPRLIDLAGKNHGTLTNGPTWSGNTHPGGFGSLAFDGTDDYITTGLNPSTTLGTTFSIIAFVCPTAANNYRGIAGEHELFSGIIFGQYEDTGWGFGIGNGASWGHSVSTSLTLNTWTHLVMVVTAGVGVELFKNGVSVGTDNDGATISHRSVFDIGRAHTNSDRHFQGYISKLWILNRALSASEVRQIYIDDLAGSPRTLNWIDTSPLSFSIIPTDAPDEPQTHSGACAANLIINNLLRGNSVRLIGLNSSIVINNLSEFRKLFYGNSDNIIRINDSAVSYFIGNGKTTGDVKITSGEYSQKIAQPSSSGTILITDTQKANLIDSGRSSNTIRINDTVSNNLIGGSSSSGNINIQGTENPTKIVKGYNAGNLIINSLTGSSKTVFSNNISNLQITANNSVFKNCFSRQNASISINNISNVNDICILGISDIIRITSVAAANKVGGSDFTIEEGSANGSLEIIVGARVYSIQKADISGLMRISGDENAGLLKTSGSSNTISISGDERAYLIQQGSFNNIIAINSSENANKVVYPHADYTLRINSSPRAQSLQKIGSSTNLRILDTISPTKIVYPQLGGLTATITNTQCSFLKQLLARSIDSIVINSQADFTEISAPSTNIKFGASTGSCTITTSSYIQVISKGVVQSMPITIIAEINANELVQDIIYIYFDTEITEDILWNTRLI